MKTVALVIGVLALSATTVMAQQPGPGVIMPGDKGRWHGYMPQGFIGSYSHANVQRTVPRFCYSLRTGKFTHWGPCRVVRLPTGQLVKVAH